MRRRTDGRTVFTMLDETGSPGVGGAARFHHPKPGLHHPKPAVPSLLRSLLAALLCVSRAILALGLAFASAGCSVVGYTAGVIAGNMDRRAISADQVEALPDRQYVWLRMRDGETLSGWLAAASVSDSLSVEYPVRSESSSGLFAPLHRRAVAREAVERVEIANTSCRWLGFGVGAAADLTIAILVATIDRPRFQPDRGVARPP